LDYTPEPSQDGTAPDLPDVEVVATVNGQPIALEAYSRELARFEAGRAALGFEVSDEQGYRQQILDLLIEEELIRQAAAAQGIVVSEDQVTAELAAMIAETGEEYFRSWLQTNYYSEDEFREVLRLELMTSALLDPVIAAVPATAEHVHARHILVSTEAEAQTVVARLQAGEDFGALAAEYSTDITTRDRGGDLGWFPRGGLLVPEVDAAAFALAPGQISGMLPTAWGYHIVQTLEFDPAREVDAETRQRLLEQAIEQWRLGLRSGADIQQMVSLSS
jgi:parvulin-like peptidyl-prolyl isomerase